MGGTGGTGLTAGADGAGADGGTGGAGGDGGAGAVGAAVTDGGNGGSGGAGGAGAVGDPDGSGGASGAGGVGGTGANGGATGAAGESGTQGTSPLQFSLLVVGNPGNPADQTSNGSFGSVGYEYSVSRTETIVAQYVQFLNAVARYVPDDTRYDYLRDLWDPEMQDGHVIGSQINRSGSLSTGGYVYSAALGADQLPIANVSWFNAARFVNWLNNGQPTSATFLADPGTETGAYTLNGNDTAVVITRTGTAKYWLPSEDEWYKAAFYDASLPAGNQYWKFPTRSNDQPYNGIPRELGGANAANYNAITAPEGQKLVAAGAYPNSASFYGTLDQAGSLWEWSDTFIDNYQGLPNSMIVRGGSWSLGILNPGSEVRRDYSPDEVDDDTGFRIASSTVATVNYSAAPADTLPPESPPSETPSSPQPVPVEGSAGDPTVAMVTVGDPGNVADDTGYGRVDYTYRIAATEATVGAYVSFLNAVATSATSPAYITDLWQQEMGNASAKTGALITRSVTLDGSLSYEAVLGRENLPVAYVNWFSAARYANWINNGGTATAGTETGAYDLNGAVTGVFIRQAGAHYWIPTEDEWYKAAYYDPTKNSVGGYWKYATQSDALPNDAPGDFLGTNAANYNDLRPRGEILTPVGSFVNSHSYYGAFDMTGNLWEWNDAIVLSPAPETGEPDSRGVRGGSWSQGILAVESSTRRDYPTGYQIPGYLYYTDDDTGFRLAGAVVLAAR